MPTRHAEIFAALNAEFPRDRVRTRSGGGGTQLAYITERMAAIRLDEVVGPENWRCRYRVERLANGTDSVICTLEIKFGEEWVPKEGAGGFKGMTEKNRAGETVEDEENTAKTGYSDSFKRAASAWGVGRYLYRDGVPDFVPRTAPVPSESPAPGPESLKPAREPDTRTYWQFVSDVVAKRNDEFALTHPSGPDMVTDAVVVTGRLLWLANEAGHAPELPNPKMRWMLPGELAHRMEEVYKAHRGWVRGELRRFLDETFAAAESRYSKAVPA